jgi:hypothetical protein
MLRSWLHHLGKRCSLYYQCIGSILLIDTEEQVQAHCLQSSAPLNRLHGFIRYSGCIVYSTDNQGVVPDETG